MMVEKYQMMTMKNLFEEVFDYDMIEILLEIDRIYII